MRNRSAFTRSLHALVSVLRLHLQLPPALLRIDSLDCAASLS